jgi:peptidoglycan/LPS O-acetylase OafA/YrhL
VPSRLGYEVTRWLLFKGNTLNGYTDAQLVIGGVAWSLWYEWLFYLSLPLVALLLIRNRALTLLALVAALAVSLHPFKIGSLLDSRLPILFVYGGLVAWLAVHGRISRRFIGHPLVSVLVLCGAAVSLLAFRSIYGLTQMTLLALCFVPIALGNSLFGLLETRASLYLGEISYSIYLVHGAVLFIVFTMLAPHFAGQVSQPLYLLFMPALAPAVVLFSSLTFFAVERPGMAWGKAAAAAAGGRWIWKRPAVVKSHS